MRLEIGLVTVALIAVGAIVNGLTFALGMAVGTNLRKRKDSGNGNCDEKASEDWRDLAR